MREGRINSQHVWTFIALAGALLFTGMVVWDRVFGYAPDFGLRQMVGTLVGTALVLGGLAMRQPSFRRWLLRIETGFVLAVSILIFALIHNHLLSEFGYGDHMDVIQRVARSPYQYRILIPLFLEAILRLYVMLGAEHVAAFRLIAPLIHFLSIIAVVAVTYVYLRLWFDRTLAMLGVSCAALGYISTAPTFLFFTYSWVEVALFFMGAWAAFRTSSTSRRGWALRIAIVVIAILNRETGAFIVLIYAAVYLRYGWKTALINGLIPGLIAVAVYALLRVGYGPREDFVTLQYVWDFNSGMIIGAPIKMLLMTLSFFLPVTFAFRAGLRHAPREVKNMLLWLPAYLVPVMIFGIWWENRLFLPLYVSLLPINTFGLKSLQEQLK